MAPPETDGSDEKDSVLDKVRRRGFLSAIGAGGAALGTGTVVAGESDEGSNSSENQAGGPDHSSRERPNVVFIMADDWGYGDTSVPPFTSDLPISTPNLESLASNGARFTNHHQGAAKCTPTRAALMTGSYAPRTSVTEHWVFFPNSNDGLHPNETTVADMLSEEGYSTGCFGKWHLGDKDPFLPENQGFDTYFGIPYSNDMEPIPLIDGFEVVEEPAPNDQLIQLCTERATEFIEDNQDDPFFCYVPYPLPHLPLGVSEEFDGITGEGLFADTIRELDWGIGQIIDTVEELGLAEDTLIVVTSDDGPWIPAPTFFDHDVSDHVGSPGPFRGGKNSTYEGGSRAPTIMRWDGVIPEGTRSDALTSHLDIVPTLANLTDADRPNHVLDGYDITDLLLDPEDASSPYEYYYYHEGENLEAIQHVDSNLKYHFEDQALYNVEEDPKEETDLSDEYPEVTDMLINEAMEFAIEVEEHDRELGTLTDDFRRTSNVIDLSVAPNSDGETVSVTFTNNWNWPFVTQSVDITASTPNDEWNLQPTSETTIEEVTPESPVTVEWEIDAEPTDFEDGIYVEAEATYRGNGPAIDNVPKPGENIVRSGEFVIEAGETVGYESPDDSEDESEE